MGYLYEACDQISFLPSIVAEKNVHIPCMFNVKYDRMYLVIVVNKLKKDRHLYIGWIL
jgi:hypothetical protein